MSTQPSATAEFMRPLLGSADPENNTWLTDFSNAITYAVQNYIDNLKITYSGIGTYGLVNTPVVGTGKCITPFVYTAAELQSQCVGETTITNIFNSIATKLNGMVWTWYDFGVSPTKLVTPWTFQMKCVFTNFGLACQYDLRSTITNLHENNKVSDPINFYNIFDKHLSNCFKSIILVPTVPMTGMSTAGAFTGASVVIGSSIHVDAAIKSKTIEDVSKQQEKENK